MSNPTQGFAGLLANPATQGLLAAGLGAMGSRGTTMQAIGRGGLLGLSAFGQAQGAQQNRLLEEARKQAREQALSQLTPGADGQINATPSVLIAAGFNDPSKWEAIRNLGRDKMKQMQEVRNADGSTSIYGVNEYGGTQDTGLVNAPEIKTQDLGGQVVGMNPYTGQQAWDAQKTATIAELESQRHNRASEGLIVRGQNMTDTRAREANQLTLSKPFEVTGLDGKPLLVQQGKNGEIFPVQGYGPKVGSDKLTEQQSKDLVYLTRGESVSPTLDALDKKLASPVDRALARLPGGNFAVSSEFQQADQAGREFLAAVLRKDTGAAITNQEFDIYGRMYLPQPGDSRAVLEQKAQQRRVALDAIRSGLGTASAIAPPQANAAKNPVPKAPVAIKSDADYNNLPSGTRFVAPDGSIRVKP